MNQYTRTWDLPAMKSASFAQMLPKREFRKFVEAAEASDD
jgi:hypothetical protein